VFDTSRLQRCPGFSGGGAIFTRLFSTSITNTSFINNLAKTRPFLSNYRGTVVFANGGAVLVAGSRMSTASSLGIMFIVNCSFVNNTASGAGGAIFVEDGAVLSIYNSTLRQNFALVGTLVSSGVLSVSHCLFSNNSAHYVATDVFVSCAAVKCVTNVFSSTFFLPEGELYSKLIERGKLLVDSPVSNTKQNVCIISSFVILGNGFGPYVNSSLSQMYDSRNSDGFCGGLGDMIVAKMDATDSSVIELDLTCGTGEFPSRLISISASLSVVSLQIFRNILFSYPGFMNQTDTVVLLSPVFFCRACPPNTFQGLARLSLQSMPGALPDKFCLPCPLGANCSEITALKVTPGLYLWSTLDDAHFNVSKFAVRLPPGYGAPKPQR
jgi:predicted outer membrane repeat protein